MTVSGNLALILGLLVWPFGPVELPASRHCIGVGACWLCWGHKQEAESVLHTASESVCVCQFDGTSANASVAQSSSIVSQTFVANGYSWAALLVLIECIGIFVLFVSKLRKCRANRLAIHDIIQSGAEDSSSVSKRPDCVARARSALAASGAKVCHFDARSRIA